MILRVRCFGRWKKKLWKTNEKLELKLDMHVWWMFDRFWIDFPRISRSFLDANWFQRGYQRRSQRVMGVIVRCGGQKCCSGEKNAPLGKPGDCRNEGNLVAHLHFESKSASASLLKAPRNPPKGVSSRIKGIKRNNHQRLDKLYAFEGGCLVSLGCQNDDFFQTHFEHQTINCKQMPKVQKQSNTVGFVRWFWGFEAVNV